MVDVDFKIVLAGFFCLTAIYITLILVDHDSQFIGMSIVSIIALGIGVVIPSPIIDNNKGVLRW
jgi:hypothetical protein